MCMHVSHIIYVYDYMFLAYDLFIIYSDQFQFGSYQELKIKIVGVRIYVSFFAVIFLFVQDRNYHLQIFHNSRNCERYNPCFMKQNKSCLYMNLFEIFHYL